MSPTINAIAVVEDDVNLCNFLTQEIKRHFTKTNVTSFYKGEDALKFLLCHPVDIALFDINLPGKSGIECIRQLKHHHPAMQMMVLTVLENSESVFEALKAGAVSYLLKTTPSEKIIEAIWEVKDGGAPMTGHIARKVIGTFHLHQEKHNPHIENLSRREKEILEFLGKGYLYKEIAEMLFISLETVRTHIRNIYEKLQVNSRMEALKKTGFI